MRWKRWFILGFALLLAGEVAAGQEPLNSDYYRKWLDEDVLWIIAEEERSVFLALKSDEERDAFIEQFWARRDPDPSSIDNEFKIEHYRRVAYANENFSAGIAGWKTDLGMVYIRFGEPNRIETYPAGGTYMRERKEGGGRTAIFPTIRWEYRQIEGIGDDVELEFVDDKGGGLYELTFDKHRKDALLHSGRMGLTQDEMEELRATGTTNKRDRISRSREAGELRGIYSSAGAFEGTRDKPFEQMRISSGVNRAPAVKYKDLEAIVTARVTYNQLQFAVREEFLRLTDQQVLVPVTISLPNEQLAFRKEAEVHQARVQVFGRVTTLSNRVEAIFEDEIARDVAAPDWNAARARASVYQKRLILRPGLYKLDIAVQDVLGKRLGSAERRLEVPRLNEGSLRTSSLVLAARIGAASGAGESRFLLGDLRVVPKTEDVFAHGEELGFYLQVYNYSIDQAAQRPQLRVEYGVSSRGEAPGSWRDVSAGLRFAGSYCRLGRMISLQRLAAGDYDLRVRVRDLLSGQETVSAASFRVVEAAGKSR